MSVASATIYILWHFDEHYGIYSRIDLAEAALERIRKDRPGLDVTIQPVRLDKDGWEV